MLKGSQAIIAGTVRNISGAPLENLIIELELKRRDGGETERRQLQVAPSSLEPGGEGRYSIMVPSREWISAHAVKLKSSTRSDEIAFKSEVGARRPPERLPERREKVVVVPRPKPKKGDDYLNTPETADPIR